MRAALAFLTPIGGARNPSPRALPWFPVVGAAIGAGVGATWWAAFEIWTPGIAAALAVVANLALTGMLHVDGLGDSADGLLPHLSPERRLEVMRQPDIGAYGVAAIGSVLLLQFAALASRSPDVVVVALLWATTRAAAAVVLATRTYARPTGLADAFRGASPAAIAVPVIAALALAATEPVVAVSTVLAFVLVVGFAERRIGGYTGDVLGAAIVVAETVGLLAVAA